jgi:hypothetical protein
VAHVCLQLFLFSRQDLPPLACFCVPLFACFLLAFRRVHVAHVVTMPAHAALAAASAPAVGGMVIVGILFALGGLCPSSFSVCLSLFRFSLNLHNASLPWLSRLFP